MKLNLSIELKAAPEKVWYWLGNPDRAMMWQTNVTKSELIEETPDMIGTTFRETIEENGGSTEMEGIVTDYRENQVLAMHLSGKYNVVDAEWRLEDSGAHTLLSACFDIRFRSFLRILSIIIRPVFKKKLITQLHGELARLKELCEGDN
jgi:hypothetical protein